MIPREFRLPSSIKLAHSRFSTNQFFSVKIASNACGYNRYAFVVSKTIDKKATVRNKLRRVLREFVWQVVQKRTISKDMIFVVRKNFLKEPRETFEQVITQELQKIS